MGLIVSSSSHLSQYGHFAPFAVRACAHARHGKLAAKNGDRLSGNVLKNDYKRVLK